jgi:hypothetical protein
LILDNNEKCINNKTMKGLFLQYDDRNPLWCTKLVARNKEAAQRLGFEYLYLHESEFDNISPYWRKVFLVDKYLNLDYECIVWADTDAVLINEIEFEKCLCEDFAMAFSSNPGIFRKEWWPLRIWAAPFCAGVFLVKKCEISKEIFATWKNAYNPSLWSQDEFRKWKGVGSYGGASYEQGCFELYIFRSPKFRPYLLQSIHTRFNYLPIKGEECSSSTIFLHYWNGNRMRIWKDWGGNRIDYVE